MADVAAAGCCVGLGVGAVRVPAVREFALGIEALDRFAREHLFRTHQCVFGVLALESEPVDPRR